MNVLVSKRVISIQCARLHVAAHAQCTTHNVTTTQYNIVNKLIIIRHTEALSIFILLIH